MSYSPINIVILFILTSMSITDSMHAKEKQKLSLLCKEMFYHAYKSYMKNAFPADELKPLSCKGRYRDHLPSLNDVNDVFGNFSLTLIDSLDTLFIMGYIEEFDSATKRIVDEISFDSDVIVTTFETNIRVIGGLLSAHLLAKIFQASNLSLNQHYLLWYKDQLLDLALNVGYRLLPAFSSPTGLPYRRINLKSGMKSEQVKSVKETCTACAGSLILEFAALSRLSGDSIFEEKASKAMNVLWNSRNDQTNLVGRVINVETGAWIKKEAGVGGGIDSYYEYLAKAYLLLDDPIYLHRWRIHYAAIMKHTGKVNTTKTMKFSAFY